MLKMQRKSRMGNLKNDWRIEMTNKNPDDWKNNNNNVKEAFDFYEDLLLKDSEKNILKLKSFIRWHVEDIIKEENFSYEYNSKRIDILLSVLPKYLEDWNKCKNLHKKSGFISQMIRFKWRIMDNRIRFK